MPDKIYLYSDIFCADFIKDVLFDFETINLSNELINDLSFKNKSILFVIKEGVKKNILKSFFINNNVVFIFLNDENFFDKKNYSQAKFFKGPMQVQKFLDILKSNFISNTYFFGDIKISNEKMTNSTNGLICFLTSIEKKILIEFIKNKDLQRSYILEKVLKIKINVETKTIESHLTRIRKKLLLVKSTIQILSKEDTFFIEN